MKYVILFLLPISVVSAETNDFETSAIPVAAERQGWVTENDEDTSNRGPASISEKKICYTTGRGELHCDPRPTSHPIIDNQSHDGYVEN